MWHEYNLQTSIFMSTSASAWLKKNCLQTKIKQLDSSKANLCVVTF